MEEIFYTIVYNFYYYLFILLNRFFINPRTKKVWKQGDIYTIPNLGDTLVAIANQGASAFYEGNVADLLVSDLRKLGSILTIQDLKQYRYDTFCV